MNIFPRPARPQKNAAPPPRPARSSPAWTQPRPRIEATIATVIGLTLTAFALASGGVKQLPSELAGIAAIGVGLSLLLGFAFDARSGIRNLVRADILGMTAFYYLTLYEFLFTQTYFDAAMPHVDVTYEALWAVMIGFTGILIGRHFVWGKGQPFAAIMTRAVPPGLLLLIFWASFFLGFLHMLIGVNFDIPMMVDYMTRPRFEQPWGRGRFGDWKALINELSLLLYFIPPLAALVIARRERFSSAAVVATIAGFAWTLFYGFATGTRNLFGAYLVTFMIAFAFATPHGKRRQVIAVCAACAAAMVLSTRSMLTMRTVGFQRWWAGDFTEVVNRQSASVFVDDNLLAIAKIAAFFPERHRYLGMEIPYLSVIRPIPRAIWPGKPAGMSVTVEEDIFNTTGFTISSTFVGEAYMSGGLVGVGIFALIFGWMAGWWNRMASQRNSELGILIYSSGFFAVVITMRSITTLTTALLTPAAGVAAGYLLLKGARKILSRRGTNRPGGGNRIPPSSPKS